MRETCKRHTYQIIAFSRCPVFVRNRRPWHSREERGVSDGGFGNGRGKAVVEVAE